MDTFEPKLRVFEVGEGYRPSMGFDAQGFFESIFWGWGLGLWGLVWL